MIKNYFKLLRIPHWIKNVFVFVPLIFSKHLLDQEYLLQVFIGFITFSFASSMVYVFNDLFDAEADRKHPKKKFRPIASGAVSKIEAAAIIVLLIIIVSVFAFFVNTEFIIIISAYVVINIFYTLYLKEVVIVDLACISSGFLLRVIGGALIVNIYISSWLILTTLFISVFLAVMKRRSELVLISEHETRKVLGEYNLTFIDQISAITAACVILCYAIYTVAEKTVEYFNTENLVYSSIFVVFGIFRYMYLVFKKNKGENPTEVMLTDIPMIANLILYSVSVYIIIYLGK
ncbi:MAG: decaprenyl-phosphate phosphoribosyltransferase [Ignavibacteriae bacterium]|nr:decaprenyl-phosphate phosphoribosyltransferase [Ignavibacteriota bacterium]NOG98752.1 decaprenyl-phosphate phosphoribosyltransferase [Ignavibacteriota bacterium]